MKSIKRLLMIGVLTVASMSTLSFAGGKAQANASIWESATTLIASSSHENNKGLSIKCRLYSALDGSDSGGTMTFAMDPASGIHITYDLPDGTIETEDEPLEFTGFVERDMVDGRMYLFINCVKEVRTATGDYEGTTRCMVRCKCLINDDAVPGSDLTTILSIKDIKACHDSIVICVKDA